MYVSSLFLKAENGLLNYMVQTGLLKYIQTVNGVKENQAPKVKG
jgi:hypothetical protein